jgi:hypothetical protein
LIIIAFFGWSMTAKNSLSARHIQLQNWLISISPGPVFSPQCETAYAARQEQHVSTQVDTAQL